jgi:Tol biopolymer transport system component
MNLCPAATSLQHRSGGSAYHTHIWRVATSPRMTNSHPDLNAALSGRYTIERELGAGGMATVYLAHDIRHHRKVAVKVLRPELSAILGAERFLAEIKTTANLQHPHILSLFDSGEADGTVFYVMPYVEGESLRDRLKREQQLPIDEAVRIAREVLDALDYAHKQGIVHRDIKPENILLHGGHAMVADFGIALAASRSDGGTRMTETGMSLGTPHYMAPEQAMGERVITNKADVYALGCVLYEMLVGEPPFTGGSAQAVFARVLTDEPRSLTLQRKTIPLNVADAVRTALHKLPADRFASARDFADALGKTDFVAATTRARPVAGVTGAGNWRNRTFAALPWAVAIIGVGAAVASWLQRPPQPASHQRIVLWKGSGLGNITYNLAISPDGRTIAFVDTVGGQRQLWLKEGRQLEPKPLTGTAGARGPVFSPDGEWIAFIADGKVRKVPRLGGSPTTLADSGNTVTQAIAWMDDGTVVFSDQRYRLRSVSLDGGPVRRPTADTATRGVVALSPLPGGRGVLATMCTPGCRDVDLQAFDFRTGVARRLGDEIVRGWYTPHGDVVFVRRDGGVFAAPFDLDELAFTTAPVPVLDGVSSNSGNPDFALSSSGTVIYIRGPGRDVGETFVPVWVDRTGRSTPVDADWSFESRGSGLALSPDGKRVAVAVIGGRDIDIWVKQLDRGPVMRLTFGGTNERPRWTADGRSLLFVSRHNGNEDIRMRRADGTGAEQVVLDHQRALFEIEPTRDSMQWIVRSGSSQSRDVHLWRRGTSELTPLLADPSTSESMPALSPDGRWLAYVSNESSRQEVYVRPFPDVQSGKWQVSRNGGGEPLWAHSGRELLYRDGAGQMMSVAVNRGTSFELGEQRALFSAAPYANGGISYRGYDLTADDRRFLFMRPAGSSQSGVAAPSDLVRIDNWFAELRDRR